MTAIVHTRNAERYLEEVLGRLRDFDEVLLVDMDSTDATLDIARRAGCRIMQVEPVGYADPARDPAMRAASHDWVFFVDADELVTPELTAWLRDFIRDPGADVRAAAVPRKNGFLDSWSRATYPDYQVRVLDRRYAEWPAFVHSNPVVKGKIYEIPRRRHELAMLHKAPTVEEMMERLNRYTTLEKERNIGRRVGWFDLWFRPKLRFFKSFVLKGGFRDGVRGYIAARHDASYQFYYLTKILEHHLREREK